jgi:LysM repeat protein
MLPEEPPSPLGHQILLFTRHVRGAYNSFQRRLPAIIPVTIALFLTTAFVTDVYASWRVRVTPQDVGEAERVAFTLTNYLNLDTLSPAHAEGDLSTIAFAGQNVGGLEDTKAATKREHIVAPGDTLSGIAEQYGLRSGTIVLANKTLENTELIHPGMVLHIPENDAPEDQLRQEMAERQKRVQVAATQRQGNSRTTVRATMSGVSDGSLRLRKPMDYRYKSQGFSLAHPGIDYAGPVGLPVYAVASGCVVLHASGWNGGYGTTVVQNIGGGYTIRYAHLSGFAKGISNGACFEAGEVIGYNGNTGRSTGPHLHLEVRLNGVPRDPAKFGI